MKATFGLLIRSLFTDDRHRLCGLDLQAARPALCADIAFANGVVRAIVRAELAVTVDADRSVAARAGTTREHVRS